MSDPATEDDLKKRFALGLLRDDNAFRVAMGLFPGGDNVGKCLQVSTTWPNDPVVIAEMERLLGEADEDEFLPSRFETARQVYAIATSEGFKSTEDRLKAFRLYSEIRGFIVKPDKDGGGPVNQQPPTFVIKAREPKPDNVT